MKKIPYRYNGGSGNSSEHLFFLRGQVGLETESVIPETITSVGIVNFTLDQLDHMLFWMLGRDCICQFYKTICSSGILARFVQGVFYLKFVIFLAYASYVAVLVFYLPGGCTHTDTKGKQREARVPNILKFWKNTIFNEHPVDLQIRRPLLGRDWRTKETTHKQT